MLDAVMDNFVSYRNVLCSWWSIDILVMFILYYYILVLSCTATDLALRSMHGCNAIHTADPMSIHEVE